MARVNHKTVKRLMNEKRSKITDKQFFTSRILAGHFGTWQWHRQNGTIITGGFMSASTGNRKYRMRQIPISSQSASMRDTR